MDNISVYVNYDNIVVERVTLSPGDTLSTIFECAKGVDNYWLEAFCNGERLDKNERVCNSVLTEGCQVYLRTNDKYSCAKQIRDAKFSTKFDESVHVKNLLWKMMDAKNAANEDDFEREFKVLSDYMRAGFDANYDINDKILHSLLMGIDY